MNRFLTYCSVVATEILIMLFIAKLIDPTLGSSTCGDAMRCAVLALNEHPVRALLVDIWGLFCATIILATIIVAFEQ